MSSFNHCAMKTDSCLGETKNTLPSLSNIVSMTEFIVRE